MPVIVPLDKVTAPVVWLKVWRSNVPPPIVRAPVVNSRSTAPNRNVPAVTFVPPLKRFTAPNTIVPAPVLFSIPVPLIAKLTVKVWLAST